MKDYFKTPTTMMFIVSAIAKCTSAYFRYGLLKRVRHRVYILQRVKNNSRDIRKMMFTLSAIADHHLQLF